MVVLRLMLLRGTRIDVHILDGTVTLLRVSLLLWWVGDSPEGHVSLLMQVRQSAGLLLKNNLKAQYAATTEEFRKYIKVGHCCIL